MKTELYIHIPFCKRKCNYCDFLSFPAKEDKIEKYCLALEEEIKKTAEVCAGEHIVVPTVFIGGGTPSLLTPRQIRRLFACLRNSFFVEDDAEISIEANPGTLSLQKLEAYQEVGINRLSIGLQSSDDGALKVLGRIHTWEEFENNYRQARKLGFSNINIDLMSGLPGQSLKQYTQGLKAVAELKAEHLSCYSLIMEEGTPFYSSKDIWEQLPDEETEREMYERTKEILEEKGYHRYEISNYSQKGKECRHNLGYWDGVSYLGFGLGAASYYNGARFSNRRDIEKYTETPYIPAAMREDYHELSKEEKMEDYMIFGLRKMEGVSLLRFEKEFGVSAEKVYKDVIQKYAAMNLLIIEGERLKLTDAGIDVSNRIFEDFLF